jgi:Thermolysin metallopeptidase, alpha-helical domain/Thermolysin metallopeptidase, catalytic domain
MDLGAVIAAVAGALGGGAATAVGGVARSRGSARTAARLIYAELTRGGAAVAYFRMTGSWPAGTLPLTAWEQYGRSLAQLRQSRAFDAVHRGYAALEAVQYLASGVDLAGSQRDDLLEHAIDELAEAFQAIGRVARVPREMVDTEVDRLLEAAPPPDRVTSARPLSGAVPPLLLNRIIDRGDARLRATASGSQVPAGTLRRSRPRAVSGTNLIIFDAGHRKSLERDEFEPVRRQGDPPTGDRDADDAYDAMAAAVSFAREVLHRSSIDDTSAELAAVVHYGQAFNNAFWNGEMLFLGDGDGTIFGSFSRCPDIVAHEVFHAMPGIGDLTFRDQSGALVESLCDVFGSLVVQYARGETVTEASWLQGESLFAPTIRGDALRSLRAPGTAYDDPVLGKDPQPAHMDAFVTTTSDNGGVHINGGIPSHAFYLLATALGGHAWERAGQIWYDAVTAGTNTTRPDFAGFARRTVTAAARRFGSSSEETAATRNAWRAVGVRVRG